MHCAQESSGGAISVLAGGDKENSQCVQDEGIRGQATLRTATGRRVTSSWTRLKPNNAYISLEAGIIS